MDKKNSKIVNALFLLFIGEFFTALGLFVQLDFILPVAIYITIIALAGMIISLVGIIKLFRANKYFLVSFICICLTFVVAFIPVILKFSGADENALNIFNSFEKVFAKAVTFAFTFGIIRGLSKAALGKANTKFANIMSLVNFLGKFLSILFFVLAAIVYEKNDAASTAFLILSLSFDVGVEVFFLIYLYRGYDKAKKSLAS